MAKKNHCPQCGTRLTPNAPEGLCPRCLMKAGLEREPDVTGESSGVIEEPGTTIGRYKLLELIGEGGMGLVYLAEQQEPVRRQVALKIIKPGMDSKQVIARFEAERQVLALLDHPNIARVFDAGTTEAGRPYFVMEYVKGMSITKYCDRHKLSVEKRLKLFLRVCEAVHHAHQKGIIHRDIKPSNILVSVQDDRAIPKIIDFGIAKAVTQPLTEQTLYTRQGQLLGTPEYMSPEQADMGNEDIDTRADLYSLGVVLYELLTGVLPFEHEVLEKVGFAELQRILQEEEPPRPSLRFTALGEEAKKIAERRHTQVVALARRLHRELEWIPLKAMRKDRSRRYRSASELADDIQNYLSGAPLIAGPETGIYRVKKFVRKHAGSVATVILVAVALILGFVVSTTMYFRAEKARQN
ncbi:MAG: protein kinase domain-containing protein, partial [Planctomycetota bacterium]